MTVLYYQTWLVLLWTVTDAESPEQENQPLRVVIVSVGIVDTWVCQSLTDRTDRGGLEERREGMRMREEERGEKRRLQQAMEESSSAPYSVALGLGKVLMFAGLSLKKHHSGVHGLSAKQCPWLFQKGSQWQAPALMLHLPITAATEARLPRSSAAPRHRWIFTLLISVYVTCMHTFQACVRRSEDNLRC